MLFYKEGVIIYKYISNFIDSYSSKVWSKPLVNKNLSEVA